MNIIIIINFFNVRFHHYRAMECIEPNQLAMVITLKFLEARREIRDIFPYLCSHAMNGPSMELVLTSTLGR
jgi:hypothetical protein